jgi:general L-amino acid transport system substrate-binding protein
LKAQRIINLVSWLVACVLLIGIASSGAGAANRLAEIRARGMLSCGIWPYVPGFALEHDGRYSGFDIDTCRAVAIAIFGEANRVGFVTLENVTQFAEHEDIDLAVRRLTWTLGRETESGVVFGPVTFYDGQGFLVPKNESIESVAQLGGGKICVIDIERHPETLRNYIRDKGYKIRLDLVSSDEEAEKALRGDRCKAYSADISWLAAARSTFVDGVARYDILPETISKEPLAPVMRAEDTEFVALVRWTIYALIEAEELGVSSHNVGNSEFVSPRVQRFLRIHPHSDVALGAGDWSRAIVAGIGNYGEMFDRNLGANSSIELDRGLNRLWNDGGLMYAPPLDR